ncbi:(Fe-S)-binding protein [Geodermatophilus sp. SYSU D00742]
MVLWPDTFTNSSADAPGRAAVEVLEAMGSRVVLPADSVCCGLTWHSTGRLDRTQKVLRDTLAVMEPLLEAGYPVIGLEPSCIVMLQEEVLGMLPDDPRAGGSPTLATTLGAFTARHLDAGGPCPSGTLGTDAGAAAAVCQVRCHQKAVHGYDAELRVLAEFGVDTTVVGGGCCGLAGSWRFEPGHYDVSQALAERALFPAIRAASIDTIVLADGFSCRTQIAQGTDAEGVHLAQVLAAALTTEPTDAHHRKGRRRPGRSRRTTASWAERQAPCLLAVVTPPREAVRGRSRSLRTPPLSCGLPLSGWQGGGPGCGDRARAGVSARRWRAWLAPRADSDAGGTGTVRRDRFEPPSDRGQVVAPVDPAE